MYQRIRPHLPQFAQYLLSGGTAAAAEIGSYQLLLMMGTWYVAADWISGGIGVLVAFTLHKYLVFKKKERTVQHAARFSVLQAANYIVQRGLVVLFVEVFGAPPLLGKILGIGVTVSWNFFIYKFLIYV